MAEVGGYKRRFLFLINRSDFPSCFGIFQTMDTYFISITVIGIAALGMTWIPTLAEKINISYSIIFLGFGMLLYALVDELPWPNPFQMQTETLHLTELVVIVALMGTGLKIDHPFSFRQWQSPFRLVTITMLLSIVSLVGLSAWLLGFDWASAMLLGAVLAPTDPVLAADVQVGGPNEGKNDDVRFSLTAEAGLNDGMAFPFTWMAVVIALAASSGEPWLGEWVGKYLLYKIAVGVGIGWLAGKGITYLFFHLPEKYEMLHVRDGLVAFSSTLFIYGVTELAQGYGFIAVFVAAITVRNYEMEHEYHQKLHSFTDQIERVLLAILLILFGGSLVEGILGHLTLPMAMLGIGFVLLIRPLSGFLGLLGVSMRKRDKWAVSFFGIKGIGSFFYLSFALSEADFAYQEEVWSLTAFVVLVSILVHGLTASFIMEKLKTDENHPREKVHV